MGCCHQVSRGYFATVGNHVHDSSMCHSNHLSVITNSRHRIDRLAVLSRFNRDPNQQKVGVVCYTKTNDLILKEKPYDCLVSFRTCDANLCPD